MMVKVGIIGTGACGNNVTLTISEMDESLIDKGILKDEQHLFKLQAVNSTSFDMTLLQDKDIYTKIIGGDGCGKSRPKSKKLFKENSKELISDLVTELKGCLYVVVIAGLGGGTGSGNIAIMIDTLRSQYKYVDDKKEKKVIYIAAGVMPSLKEGLQELKNAIDAVHELNTLDIAFMLLDNSSVTSASSIKDVFNIINNSITEDMRIIRGDFNSKPSISNMDEQDCRRLYSTAGYMTINKIAGFKEVDLDKSSLDDLILKSIRESYSVQMEKDRIIGKIGVIYNITERMLEKYDESMAKLQDEVGKTPHRFKHINIVENESECSIITILTGLSIPDSRLIEMEEILNESQEALSKEKESKIKNIKSSTDWLKDDDDDDTEEDEKTSSLDDVLNKWK
jgi:Cell division GTPase